MNSKIVLFGGSGYLGSNLKKQLKNYKVFSPTHNQLDLLNVTNTLNYISNKSPDIIIYCAGITKIDFAESNKSLTFKLNFEIPKKISKFATKNNIKFVYISTDAVFDGYKRKFEFAENDKTNSKSIYGKSKLLGEKAVLNASFNNLILRAITLFGGVNDENNFVNVMINQLKKNKNFFGIYDQIQNPLNVNIAAKAIEFSIKKNLRGIYNLGAVDSENNYHFLLKIAKSQNFDPNLINRVSFKEFMRNKKGHRKQKSILKVNKFNKVSENKILMKINESIKLYSITNS